MEVKKELRDYRFDIIKLFLITLVVYAHIPLLNGFLPDTFICNYDEAYSYTMKGIYAFHMPLFVFISGYFTKRKDVKEAFIGSKRLLWYLCVFQALDLIIRYVITNDMPSLRACVSPCFALWYLLCLFYWRILLSLIPQSLNRHIVIISSIVLSILAGFVPVGGELGFQRFLSFMPYFMTGHYYGKDLIKYLKMSYIPPPKWVILTFLFILIFAAASLNPLWLDCIVFPYRKFQWFVVRIGFLIYSSFLSMLIVTFFSKTRWSKSELTYLGSNTLLIYLLHPYILASVVWIWQMADNNISLIDGLLITAITMTTLYGISKIKMIRLFFQ